MTVRRRKPSFASLLGHASRRDDEIEPLALEANGAFRVDPARVRLWNGLAAPSAGECRDRIAAIARDGQIEPVTVRPVFDDELFEYEVIAGARDWVAVRHLRDTATPRLDLLVRVALVDDDGAGQLTNTDPELRDPLPDPLVDAFGGETVPADVAADLAQRLHGPMAPAILAAAGQIARAQDARRSDGLPPYAAGEVMQLIDAVGTADEPPPIDVSLSIADASSSTVTFRLAAADDLPPETLARIVKAMIDGATAEGIAVRWAGGG